MSEFPAYYWSPKGEKRAFLKAADVPSGWTPFNPKDADAKAKAEDRPEPGVKAVRRAPAQFPAWYWSPEGEKRAFNSEGEVLSGWTPYHPRDKAKADAPKRSQAATSKPADPIVAQRAPTPAPGTAPSAATGGLSREEIIAALTERSIKFNPQSSTSNLYEFLCQHVEAKS